MIVTQRSMISAFSCAIRARASIHTGMPVILSGSCRSFPWNGKDYGKLRERLAAYAEISVQYIMVHPLDRDVDDRDAVIDGDGRAVAA